MGSSQRYALKHILSLFNELPVNAASEGHLPSFCIYFNLFKMQIPLSEIIGVRLHMTATTVFEV